MKSLLTLVFFLFCALFISCGQSTAPANSEHIMLTAEYVGASEVKLRLQIDIPRPYNRYELIRDKQAVQAGLISAKDTILLDTTVQSAQVYAYKAKIFFNKECLAQSSEITINTIDTTSHEFSIDKFAFGEKTMSTLYDVKIINQNNIWVVGEIYNEDSYTYDSLGNWIDPYNAAQWNGIKWELKRIYFNYQGSKSWGPIYSIFAFNSNDIWFGMGSLIHWNGINFNSVKIPDEIFPSRANKIWGSSSNDLYIVGNNGCIVHYNSQIWKKLDTGTDSPIHDIWGDYDDNDKEYLILCPASRASGEKKLLRIHPDHSVTQTNWIHQNRSLHSVWFKDKFNTFFCGGGVYLRNRFGEYEEFIELPLITTNAIRGQKINDVFVAGDFGILAHYNGKSWRQYTYFDEVDIFFSIDYKENLVIAVGFKEDQAVVYMLRKI